MLARAMKRRRSAARHRTQIPAIEKRFLLVVSGHKPDNNVPHNSLGAKVLKNKRN
jgi:hypothetical protein